MTKAEILSKLKAYISVSHHSSGRLRLDISSKIKELKDLENFDLNELFALKGVSEVKVNKILGKVTILYDASVLSKDSLERLLNADGTEQIEAALKELNLA